MPAMIVLCSDYHFLFWYDFVHLARELQMKKIVIIGPPGSGKTTLASDLGPLLKVKVFSLDRFFWESGWKGKSREERLEILDHLVQEKQWIIEGTYLDSSEPRLNAADTIIFVTGEVG